MTDKAPQIPTIDQEFFFTKVNATQALMALAAASGRESLNVFDLNQWRVPGAGSTVWQVDGKHSPYLEGVIIHHHAARNYWPGKFGETQNRPPACFSPDGLEGFGNPGGECAKCPYAQFGEDDSPSACRQVYRLYVLPVDAALPVHLAVPTMSIKPVRQYLASVARNYGMFAYQVLTRFKLRVEKSSRGVAYSQIEPELVGFIAEKTIKEIGDFSQEVRKTMARPRLIGGSQPQAQTAPQQGGGGAPPPLFSVEEVDDDIADPVVPSQAAVQG
jgi:hypothetical protein